MSGSGEGVTGLRVALLSLDIAWGDREENYRRVRERLTQISSMKDGRIDLLILPEMFATGFDMEVSRSAEDPEDSPTMRFMSEIASSAGVHVIGGVCTIGPGGRGLNRCLAFGPDGAVKADYAKKHLFPLAGEPSFFETGDKSAVVEVKGISMSLHVCYDIRFPEDFRPRRFLERALEREDSKMGPVVSPPDPGGSELPADAMVVIANWPATRDLHWRTLLRARAIENQCFVLGCNRSGEGGGLLYCGSSIVIDPFGETIKDDEKYRPWITAEIDGGTVSEIRKRFPFMS